MFALADDWVWDFWFADDGRDYHLFFLHAPKSLGDPDARHYNASIGHATSRDLRTWERQPDALAKGPAGSFDDQATWTGSVVRGDDGVWYLFYTGATLTPEGNVQSVGVAVSEDLRSFTKLPGPILTADRPYERLTDGAWHDEAFRDPWVFRDAAGDGWHMLITARVPEGPTYERGVVGHATSPDLRSWTLREPLSDPGQGFGQLEVMEVVELGGRNFLLFHCLAGDMAPERRDATTGGSWLAPAESPLGPYDIAGAHQLTDERFYVTRPVRDRETGRQYVMAFRNLDAGVFGGVLTDPVELVLDDGVPRLVDPTGEWAVRQPSPSGGSDDPGRP